MGLNVPHDVFNDTVADATQVRADFDYIEQYVDAEVITRDGATAMAAPLQLVGDPTQPKHAATKSYVDAVLPVGVIMPYGGETAPGDDDWMLCDGASLNTGTYPDLFGVLGYKFGGSGANFNLPNMAGKMPIGVNSADTVAPATDVVGKTGGSTVPPLKTHTHKFDHNHGVKTSSVQNVNHTHQIAHNHGSVTTAATDGDHTHTAGFRAIQEGTGTGHFLALQASDSGAGLSATITKNAGEHTHVIDLPALPSTQSGNNSVGHTHNTDLDLFAGTTPAPVETVDTKYRPPYMTLSFIIRVR